jgi:hypothetical protein
VERQITAELREKLQAAQALASKATEACANARDRVVRSETAGQGYAEALVCEHRKRCEWRAMLSAWRSLVFVSDVRIASAQRKAERERSAREEAQARELASLRRELRAVVSSTVAMDLLVAEEGQDDEEEEETTTDDSAAEYDE